MTDPLTVPQWITLGVSVICVVGGVVELVVRGLSAVYARVRSGPRA